MYLPPLTYASQEWNQVVGNSFNDNSSDGVRVQPPYEINVWIPEQGSKRGFSAKQDALNRELFHKDEVGWTSTSLPGKWFGSAANMHAFKKNNKNRRRF
jgi:hypothetical protein